MNKVEVTLKTGKTIEVLPQEVKGLREARVLQSVAKEKKEAGKTKEEKETGETKEKPTGTITSANFKDNTKKA